MTKRAKPKTAITSTVTPTTINSTAPTKAVESIEVKSNTSVAPKAKKANSTTTGASKRPRSKKVVEAVIEDAPASPPIKITYKYDPKWDEEPKLSLYDRFVGWLFKLSLPFRGF
jgi:hypothetical protein